MKLWDLSTKVYKNHFKTIWHKDHYDFSTIIKLIIQMFRISIGFINIVFFCIINTINLCFVFPCWKCPRWKLQVSSCHYLLDTHPSHQSEYLAQGDIYRRVILSSLTMMDNPSGLSGVKLDQTKPYLHDLDLLILLRNSIKTLWYSVWFMLGMCLRFNKRYTYSHTTRKVEMYII